ncbi:MAG TPA: PHP domain-containing protein [Kofleriaceae bacterium]|jgi:hypothetical protein
MRFDLHCHSTCSDGTESPSQVAARVAARGVEVFALTDHDTCAGCAEIAALLPGVRVLRAVELSCDDAGRTVHVLAYDRGGAWDALVDRLAAVRTARANRVRVMCAKLERRGIVLDVEALAATAAHESVGRPHLARAMVAAGHASSVKDAFARHLYDHGPVDVPHTALPLFEALAVGRAAGAALSLAHPHLYGARARELLVTHQRDGLTGVEAYYGAYHSAERADWLRIADELGLVATGGSDWHGPDDARVAPGIDFGVPRTDALLRWLA